MITATKLTDGERLFLWRRRKEMSQEQCAKELGVEAHEIFRFENGEKVTCKIPKKSLGNLTPLEICLIRRRRQGWTQAEVAKQAGFSRWWINRMELGIEPATKLLAFWDTLNEQGKEKATATA